MFSIIGALAALALVLVLSVLVSQRVTEHFAHKRQQKLDSRRAQTLRTIETELEELEARKSARTADDNEAYARLIRRRNLMVA